MKLHPFRRAVTTAAHAAAFALLAVALPAAAQDAARPSYDAQSPRATPDYVVGPHDVLSITSYDDATLTGKFAVDADRTFTYPLIGRVQAGGLTLREVEATLEAKLEEQGFFRAPEISVGVADYRSRKIFILGEVRKPGAYTLSGDMRLVEALALAGSTLPSASWEAVVVPSDGQSESRGTTAPEANGAARVDLDGLQNGKSSQNVHLSDGDTIFVLRAENVFVFGEVNEPGAYPLRQRDSTVLQALSLAGGVTDIGTTSRIEIVRTVDGKRTKIKVDLSETLQPGDTIVVPRRYF